MSDPEAADQRPRQRIYDARESMHEARLALKTENMAGSPSMTTRRRFCAVLSAYYDVLKEHRDDPALDPPWDERRVDWIDRWVQEDVTRKVEPSGTGYGTREREVNKLASAPISRLLDGADELDRIAKDLGFAAETTDHTPEDEFGLTELYHILTVRDQEQPAEEVLEALEAAEGGEKQNGDNTDDAAAAAATADD
jgi:translation elongation factor EF-1beta